MPTKFTDLPVELRKIILNHVYEPWHLCTEKIPAFSGFPVFTFTTSRKVDSGPVLACRAMHALAIEAINASFTGELDASNAAERYSVMPKFKFFLPKVSKLVLQGFKTMYAMGDVYIQRLPALKIIAFAAERIITVYDHGLSSNDSLTKVINTPIVDEAILHRFDMQYRYLPSVVHELNHKKKIAVRFQRVVQIDGFDDEVVSKSRNMIGIRLIMNRLLLLMSLQKQSRL